ATAVETLAGGGNGEPRSEATGALAAGGYRFKATVAGDANYVGDTSAGEPFTVDKAQLSVTTTVHDASHAVIADNAHVPLGTNAHDNANVTGGVSGFPVPAVSFTFDGSGIASNGSTESGFDATSVATGALGAGDYLFKATVAGNANYVGATSTDEPFTVDKAQLLMDSQVHNAAHVDETNASVPLGSVLHDTARITDGLVDGLSPAPITFRFYSNGTCDGAGSAVANVGADEGAPARHRSAASNPLAAGHYSYKAFVADNADYLGTDSGCEPFSVNTAASSTATQLHNNANEAAIDNGSSVDLGTSVHDKATVSSGNAAFDPTGDVTFT